MSNPTTPQVPAGWYTDPAGSGQNRWWDGTQWTSNFQQPYSQSAVATALRAPEGTDPYTLWIWAIVALIALLALPPLFIDYGAIYDQALRSDTVVAPWTPAEVVSAVLGWVGVAAFVVFAFLDYRALNARGVPNAFHWAWMFFAVVTPLVYIIGRSVVAKRRTGHGSAPIWVAIALTLASIAISLALVVPATIGMLNSILEDPDLYR